MVNQTSDRMRKTDIAGMPNRQGKPVGISKEAVLEQVSRALDRLEYGDIIIKVVDRCTMFVDVNERIRIS